MNSGLPYFRFQRLIIAALFVIFMVFLPLGMSLAQDKTTTTARTSKPAARSQTPFTKPTVYLVGYAHLDTQWRWEYPQVIREFLPKTLHTNFVLFRKYPHYIFNFSGANRYRMMKEYYPADYAQLRQWVKAGRWFPAGSSMEENDVNSPSPESIIRQVLYGNEFFRHEFGVASAEFMIPDCFGFPASLPSILRAAGVKGFSTQKLTWGSAAVVGGPTSPEQTPKGIPFNVGFWDGPDGKSLLVALNPGDYTGNVGYDLSESSPTYSEQRNYVDWPHRLALDAKASGLAVDYHYFGTGDTGGAPTEASVKLLEAIVTRGQTVLPSPFAGKGPAEIAKTTPQGAPVTVGEGPVQVVSSKADQMFLDVLGSGNTAHIPHYRGDLELTNHSAGSLTSEAAHKGWNHRNEILADAAERASVAAAWLGGPAYPQKRLTDAWALVLGGQFHDIMAGTATPKAYEYSWNDDAIATNQFAGVLTSAVAAVASAMNTQAKGVAVVVYNPLNIEREDVVEAALEFPQGAPRAVRVIAPDGHEAPAQIESGRVLFLAKAPAVGFAVYDVEPAHTPAVSSELKVSGTTIENAHYRITINAQGDVASIFDKSLNRELLAAPARLAFQTEHPFDWPGWNMDWADQRQPPRGYVSGAAQIRVVESGPARAAVEVTRETEGSKFVQTIRLAAGGAGNRVEFKNAVDWRSREAALKATFPLTASNPLATYNWGVGTIQRGNNDEAKFEVASHQWFDLTDQNGSYGVTILSGAKTGSDKPDDHTLRLTLLYTPGLGGGNGLDYVDQISQDWGHHEFVYGLTSHGHDWRQHRSQLDAERLDAPMFAFQTAAHAGSLGKTFQFLAASPNQFVSALKRAEDSNEVVVRVMETMGTVQAHQFVRFPTAVLAAREMDGQEQPVGPAQVVNGILHFALNPYEIRTFSVKLAPPAQSLAAVRSQAVALNYDRATASEDGATSPTGFDASGDALPASMLPAELPYGNIMFHLGRPGGGLPNALLPHGQSLPLPAGKFNRVYLLAAGDGDQQAAFGIGKSVVELNIQDWKGYIGQWDTRTWTSGKVTVPTPAEPADDDHSPQAEQARKTIAYIQEHGPITSTAPVASGLVPGFIKPASVAWFASHRHTAQGANEPYAYCYLYAYSMEIPDGARSLRLPDNNKVRILAITVAEEPGLARPAQPLLEGGGE